MASSVGELRPRVQGGEVPPWVSANWVPGGPSPAPLPLVATIKNGSRRGRESQPGPGVGIGWAGGVCAAESPLLRANPCTIAGLRVSQTTLLIGAPGSIQPWAPTQVGVGFKTFIPRSWGCCLQAFPLVLSEITLFGTCPRGDSQAEGWVRLVRFLSVECVEPAEKT